MTMWPIIILVGIVFLALALGLFVLMQMLRRRLTVFAARRIEMLIAGALAHGDARIKVLELDKALDALLTSLGYKGSLGEKLIAAGSRLPNIDALWTAHKLRNRVAHETDVAVSDRDVEQMCDAIHKALRHVSSSH